MLCDIVGDLFRVTVAAIGVGERVRGEGCQCCTSSIEAFRMASGAVMRLLGVMALLQRSIIPPCCPDMLEIE